MSTSDPSKEDGSPALALGTVGGEPFLVDANAIVTGRTCVIGASGSGKSYAVGVICEELCKNKVPFAIIDTEGEHAGLKEKYEVIWVGDDRECDLQWSTLNTTQLASQAPDVAPLVLDLSEDADPRSRAGALIGKIYEEVERRRTPYLIIVEEADRFIPQNGERVPIFGEIARRGRKRGLGLMVCTQRPSLVDKNILSQCGNQLIGKLVIKNDLQSVSQFFSSHELLNQLTTLPAGTFFAMGGLSPVSQSVVVRKKETQYKGNTPKLGPRVVKEFTEAPAQVAIDEHTVPEEDLEGVTLGFNPLFHDEDIPQFVKRDKRFTLFGREETVAGAVLVYKPLIEVGVALRTGVIKKRVEVRYMILDGLNGNFLELGEVPAYHDGFERLLGLDAGELEVLWTTKLDRDTTLLEVAGEMGVSKESLRTTIRKLEQKRLVRSMQVGRTRVYRRLVAAPDPVWQVSEQALETLDPARTRPLEYRVSESEVDALVKGSIPQALMQSYRQFAYPCFRVEMLMDRRKRIVWLDGRSGKEMTMWG